MAEAGYKSFVVNMDGKDYSDIADIFWDNNPLHRDLEYANSRGHKEILVPGMFLQSCVIECAMQNNFNFYNQNIIKFANFVYPKDKVSFYIDAVNDKRLRVAGENSRGENVINFETFSQGSIYEREKISLISTLQYEISESRVKRFYSHLENTCDRKVPLALVSAMIPSALLKLSSKDSKSSEGVYKRVDFNVHEIPSLGEFDVQIYLVNQRSKDNKFMYNFKGVCSQNGIPILSEKITVFTEKELSL